MPDAEELADQFERMLMSAIREPARARMRYWAIALEEHRRHPSFRTHGWAYSREVGFTCECTGQEQEWRVSLMHLREMLPRAREAFLHIHDSRRLHGNKTRRRARRRADRRAKALLHRHLTREQRWELRATRSVTVTGQDGRTYRITEGSCNNVFLLEDGEERFRLCAVADFSSELSPRVLRDGQTAVTLDGQGYIASLPVHDLMLAQKLLIESDIRAYLSVAQAMNVRTQYCFKASVLLDELPDDSEQVREWMPSSAVEVPDEALEDPGSWATARLREAETFREDGYADTDAERQAG